MPRQVDHDHRRRHIAEAVWRLAAQGGLEHVTLRQVAAEAGVPARQLQYYFGTRERLLLGALEILNADAERLARARVEALGPAPGTHATVRAVLHELLPLDEERRTRHLVYAAYFIPFVSDPVLAKAAKDRPDGLEELVAGLLAHGRDKGEVGRSIDPVSEGAFLTAGAWGLQSSVLLGQFTPDRAVELLDHQLDRVFP